MLMHGAHLPDEILHTYALGSLTCPLSGWGQDAKHGRGFWGQDMYWSILLLEYTCK